MKLQDGRGIETPRWNANEIVTNEDMGFASLTMYQGATNLLALLAEQGKATGSTKDLILAGLLFEWVSGMTCSLRAGSAVSYSGAYISGGVWGFVANAENIFSVLVGQDTSLILDVGAVNDRYDTIQVRPVLIPYDSKARNYKDPVTAIITSALTFTKLEFGIEIGFLKGTPGAGVAPTHTAGWIKVAEVLVHTADTVIDQAHIKDVRSSAAWTTEASATKYKHITDAAQVPIADVGGLIAATDVEGALQEVSAATASIISSDTTLASGRIYRVIQSDVLLTLPASPSAGDTLDIEAAFMQDSPLSARISVIQTDSEHQIAFGRRFSTKGIGGLLSIPDRLRVKMFYRGVANFRTEPWAKLSDPPQTNLGNQINGMDCTSDGIYLALVQQSVAKKFQWYKRSGDSLSILSDPATVPSTDSTYCEWSLDGVYLSVTIGSASPYFYVYKRTGDSLAKLTDAGSLPTGTCVQARWDPSGKYLAVVQVAGATVLHIYTLISDTLTRIANLTIASAANNMAWSRDGRMLIVTNSVSPYHTIIAREGGTFVDLTSLIAAFLPNAQVTIEANPDGRYFAFAGATSPYFQIYEWQGRKFTLLCNPDTAPPAGPAWVKWLGPTYFAFSGGNINPRISFYRLRGDAMQIMKVSDPATLPTTTARGICGSRDGKYVYCGQASASPYLLMYKSDDIAVNKRWEIERVDGAFYNSDALVELV